MSESFCALLQQFYPNWKKTHATLMSTKPEPAIWSRNTGGRISWYDSCQVNIICVSNIKNICCNPRLHDLVLAGWPPCCATSFAVVRRRCEHAPLIHAASHFDHKKRVAWVTISIHTCGFFFYNYGAPLSDPSGRRSSAIIARIECLSLVNSPFHG